MLCALCMCHTARGRYALPPYSELVRTHPRVDCASVARRRIGRIASRTACLMPAPADVTSTQPCKARCTRDHRCQVSSGPSSAPARVTSASSAPPRVRPRMRRSGSTVGIRALHPRRAQGRARACALSSPARRPCRVGEAQLPTERQVDAAPPHAAFLARCARAPLLGDVFSAIYSRRVSEDDAVHGLLCIRVDRAPDVASQHHDLRFAERVCVSDQPRRSFSEADPIEEMPATT